MEFVHSDPINSTDPLGLDDAGCDIVNKIVPSVDKDPCFRACCDVHDWCYKKYGCTMFSFVYLWGDCKRCNDFVVRCFKLCAAAKASSAAAGAAAKFVTETGPI